MALTRPPFPKVLNSSAMTNFHSCPRKFQLADISHWKPKGLSVHLHAGAAYATGLEKAREAYFQDGKSPADAEAAGMHALFTAYGDFECPSDSAKSLERMCGALAFYFDRYPLESDPAVPITLPGGKRGIEFSFAEPMDVNHPETGDPILYCGRMDSIVDYAGAIYGEDDKTTSSLGASWAKQWDLRSQFTGYCWGAGKAGFPLSGFLVRGISILKTKYDTMEALTYRPPWMIERWYEQTIRDTKRIISMWEEGYWDYNLDHACSEYSGCEFRQICLSKEPQSWLEASFERRARDPITRTEIRLA